MKRIAILDLKLLLMLIMLALLSTACSSIPKPPAITPSATPDPSPIATGPAASTPSEEGGDKSAVGEIATAVAQRTKVPTPTSGPIDQGVEQLTNLTGLADRWLLGLRTEDWINIGISVLFIFLSIILGIWVLFNLIEWVIRKTKTKLDDMFFDSIERELRWILGVVVTRWSVLRLRFLSEELRSFLEDIFFLLVWGILFLIVLRLIAFVANLYREYRVPKENWQRFDPLIELTKRLVYILVSIIFLAFGLSNFGIEVTLLSVIIVFIFLIIAIGAREALADAVGGFLILLDQPFRVGDDIQLIEMNTRGEVVEIGIRITRIRTADNRQIIIPNSIIGQGQVVNYTYPDPTIRLETDIVVAHGTDIDQVKDIIKEALRGVEGVLPDKPVNVFHLAFFGSARQIRVQWWIDVNSGPSNMLDQVNAAIEGALDEANIKLPNPEYFVNY